MTKKHIKKPTPSVSTGQIQETLPGFVWVGIHLFLLSCHVYLYGFASKIGRKLSFSTATRKKQFESNKRHGVEHLLSIKKQ